MPKISVIIPIYNSEKYLRQCLDSVINQTFKDIEIICVDDGSTDSSKEILEEYSKKDKRIIVINQKNLYAGVARNNGIETATGDYIHFLDSDDWIKNKNTYKYLYNKMLKFNVDVIFFQFDKYDIKSGRTIKYRRTFRRNNKITNIKAEPKFFLHYAPDPWCKFYDRKFIMENQLRFDDIIASNDTAFFFKVILSANQIMVSKKSFIMYRVGDEGSLTGKCRFENYECHFKAYESIKENFRNIDLDIKRVIVSNTIENFLNFYHKSYGEYTKIIYEKLYNYFKIMDISVCENNSNEYYWWDEYIAIKTGNFQEAQRHFNINRIVYGDRENKIKYYIKKYMKHIRTYGIRNSVKSIYCDIKSKLTK